MRMFTHFIHAMSLPRFPEAGGLRGTGFLGNPEPLCLGEGEEMLLRRLGGNNPRCRGPRLPASSPPAAEVMRGGG